LPLARFGVLGLVTLEVAIDPPHPAEIIAAAASNHNLTALIFRALLIVLRRRTLPWIT
jgi:hypothetical protein